MIFNLNIMGGDGEKPGEETWGAGDKACYDCVGGMAETTDAYQQGRYPLAIGLEVFKRVLAAMTTFERMNSLKRGDGSLHKLDTVVESGVSAVTGDPICVMSCDERRRYDEEHKPLSLAETAKMLGEAVGLVGIGAVQISKDVLESVQVVLGKDGKGRALLSELFESRR